MRGTLKREVEGHGKDWSAAHKSGAHKNDQMTDNADNNVACCIQDC